MSVLSCAYYLLTYSRLYITAIYRFRQFHTLIRDSVENAVGTGWNLTQIGKVIFDWTSDIFNTLLTIPDSMNHATRLQRGGPEAPAFPPLEDSTCTVDDF
jgi:hypothetical protein